MPDFRHKREYSLEFIEVLGRTVFTEDCDQCDGLGLDLRHGFVAFDLTTGDLIIGGEATECERCEGRGWHYVLILN